MICLSACIAILLHGMPLHCHDQMACLNNAKVSAGSVGLAAQFQTPDESCVAVCWIRALEHQPIRLHQLLQIPASSHLLWLQPFV